MSIRRSGKGTLHVTDHDIGKFHLHGLIEVDFDSLHQPPYVAVAEIKDGGDYGRQWLFPFARIDYIEWDEE